MAYNIEFYGYKLTKDDISIMEKMESFLKQASGKTVIVHPIDVLQYDQPINLSPNGVSFGTQLKRFSNGNCNWQLPDIKKLYPNGDQKLRKEAMNILQSLANHIKQNEEDLQPKEEQEIYVEKNGIKFGELGQIQITEKEAEHLRNIKEILGGVKIVIKKGDITIEVE
jgi:hypothetical protein